MIDWQKFFNNKSDLGSAPSRCRTRTMHCSEEAKDDKTEDEHDSERSTLTSETKEDRRERGKMRRRRGYKL